MRVFISHAQEDARLARELRSHLAEAGADVWLADAEVLPGQNLALEAGKALQRSNALVVLLSPAAVESKYVRSEVAFALASPKFEGRVVSVLVKPTKGIPWFLRTLPIIRPSSGNRPPLKELAGRVLEALATPMIEDAVAAQA
jgi:hypothetical protein